MPSKTVNRAYISLGSNINAAENLPRAVAELKQFGSVLTVSQVWQSKAVGDTNQADFQNGAVLLETTLTAEELKQSALNEIEDRLKRKRDPQNKNAARTIDLDLALFNNDVFELDDRAVPDPEIIERPFVAVPLAELTPNYLHPIEQRTLEEIAEQFVLSDWHMTLNTEIKLFT